MSCYFCLKARACLSSLSSSELTFSAICRWPTKPWSSSVRPGLTWSRWRRQWGRPPGTLRTWRASCPLPGPTPGHHQPVILSPWLGTWRGKVRLLSSPLLRKLLIWWSCCSDAKLKKGGVVSQKDIAKDQGKPISKYERNMLIFDWLHTLGKLYKLLFIKI